MTDFHAPADAVKVQRIGAYGIATRDDCLLLTRISEFGFPAGYWNLPGGQIEHGEPPHSALVREMSEEAGVQVRSAQLLDVFSTHLVGPGRDGIAEDFHGLAVIFRIELDHDNVRVVEQGGTTDAVEWVPLREVAYRDHLTIVANALEVLNR